MDDMDFDDIEREQENEQAKSNQARMVLYLKDGDVCTFRLLREASPALHFKEHTYFDKVNKENGFRAVCAASDGKPCYYCQLAAKTGNNEMSAHTAIAYPVFVLSWDNPRATAEGQAYLESQIGQPKLWIIKITKKADQHLIVKSYYKKYGSALDIDWSFSRRGEGKLAKYTLSGFHQPHGGDMPLMSNTEARTMLLSALPYKVLDAEEDAA